MVNDQLTRKERIRLEAFAQAGARHQMQPIPLEKHIDEARAIEQFLYEAERDHREN